MKKYLCLHVYLTRHVYNIIKYSKMFALWFKRTYVTSSHTWRLKSENVLLIKSSFQVNHTFLWCVIDKALNIDNCTDVGLTPCVVLDCRFIFSDRVTLVYLHAERGLRGVYRYILLLPEAVKLSVIVGG